MRGPAVAATGDVDWSRAAQAAADASTVSTRLAIEDLGADPLPAESASGPAVMAVHLYRVHARAVDANGLVVELESVYALGRPSSSAAAIAPHAGPWSRRPGRLSWRQRDVP
jgi:hypothetical protein